MKLKTEKRKLRSREQLTNVNILDNMSTSIGLNGCSFVICFHSAS